MDSRIVIAAVLQRSTNSLLKRNRSAPAEFLSERRIGHSARRRSLFGFVTRNLGRISYGLCNSFCESKEIRADAGTEGDRNAHGKVPNCMHDCAGEIFNVDPIAHLAPTPHHQRVFVAQGAFENRAERILCRLIATVSAKRP